MWFEQSVQEALAKAKSEHLIALMFVYGSNEASASMRTLLEQDEQIQSLLRGRTVALALADGSDNARMFSAICPVLVVPSTFFISYDGVPLEIVGGAIDQASLYAKVKNALRLLDERLAQSEDAPVNTTANEVPDKTSANVKPPNVRCVDGVCQLVPDESSSSTSAGAADPQPSGSTSTNTTSSTDSPLTFDQKMQKTKQLLEELRAKKAAAKAESDRKSEKDRIATAKAMQEAKRTREDNEISEMIRQREKEALEAKLAKEHVLALIRADQEERKAREKAEQEVAAATALQQQNQVCQRRVKTDNTNQATIQFRLPDGSQFVSVFEQNQSLAEAAAAVASKTTLRSFQLYQTFPKRKFETEDYKRSFVELDLVPSASLLVMEEAAKQSAITSVGGSLIGSLFSFVWASLAFMFNIFSSIFSSRITGPAASLSVASNRNESSTTSSTRSKDPGPASQSKLLRDNVSRLNDLPKDDDDNNTWNGNSTQQM